MENEPQYQKMPLHLKWAYGLFGLIMLFFILTGVHSIYVWDDFHKPVTCTLINVTPDSEGYVWRQCTTTERIEADSRSALPKFNTGQPYE